MSQPGDAMPLSLAVGEAMSPPAAAPIQLSYGRERPRWRRWFKRCFFLAWFCATAWLLYDVYWHDVKLRYQLWEAERALAKFSLSSDRVVFETEPEAIEALKTSPLYEVSYNRVAAQSVEIASQLRAFKREVGPLYVRKNQRRVATGEKELEEPLATFHSDVDRSRFQSHVPVHITRLQAGSLDRTVIVFASWYRGRRLYYIDNSVSEASDFVLLTARVLEPGAPGQWVEHPDRRVGDVVLQGRDRRRDPPSVFDLPEDKPPPASELGLRFLRLHAGRRDSTDPSRFTIEFETDAGRGMIEGQLMSDGTIAGNTRSGSAIASQPMR